MRFTSTALLSMLATPSAVIAQASTWTSFEGRSALAMASDPSGGVVLFGGQSTTIPGQLLDETYEYLGSSSAWVRQLGADGPSARRSHGMAFAYGLTVPIMVLFGGTTTSGPSSETFVYEGGGWGSDNLAVRPSARAGHAMATDLVRNRVLLFGGLALGVPRNDVWEFDPVNRTWTQVPATGGIAARSEHAMAYDAGANKMVVFGGLGGTSTLGDTWEYDSGSQLWTNVSPASAPSPRSHTAMSWLLGNGVVLFGGRLATGAATDDTWRWDATTGTWTAAAPTTRPPARLGHVLAPDQSGQNLLMLGGEDPAAADPLTGTWLWNGTNWLQLFPTPEPRRAAGLAYDVDLERHTMFGGVNGIPTAGGSNYLADTWELDGLVWRQKTPMNSPSPRAGAGLAYDSTRRRTVLFGGITGSLWGFSTNALCQGTELGDTWEWDGQNWAQRITADSPPPFSGGQPVYDPVRQKTWLLVGSAMWGFDGVNWQNETPGPSARSDFGYAWDSGRGELVVFGGRSQDSSALSDTWTWSPANGWTQRQPALNPVGRAYAEMAYDPIRQETMLFGGTESSGTFNRFTQWWNGSTWSSPTSYASGPSAREGHRLVHDPVRNVIVLRGGQSAAGIESDLWEFGSSGWNQVAACQTPLRDTAAAFFPPTSSTVFTTGHTSQPFFSTGTGLAWSYDGTSCSSAGTSTIAVECAMTFDSHTSNLLLYGGAFTTGGSTLLWNGTSWTDLTPSLTENPGPRVDHALFSTGSRTLLWGGRRSALNNLSVYTRFWNDMWEWDGAQWSQIEAGSPPPRRYYAAAYDARRDRVVIFGGRSTHGTCNYTEQLDDTWEWDGSKWTNPQPAIKPPARQTASMTFDEHRSRIVLFGGYGGWQGGSQVILTDTWEWDGSERTLRFPVRSPPATDSHSMAWDRSRQLSVLTGVTGTWDYGPNDPATIESFGTGCQSSAGICQIQPLPWSGPWLGDRMEFDFVNRPPGLGLFVLGFSDQQWQGIQLPLSLAAFVNSQCDLLVSADATVLILPGVERFISLFSLPTTASLVGLPLFCQAGFFDTGTPGSPVVSTDALRMTAGAK